MDMMRQRAEAADVLDAMSRTAIDRNRIIRRLRRRCERRLRLANNMLTVSGERHKGQTT